MKLTLQSLQISHKETMGGNMFRMKCEIWNIYVGVGTKLKKKKKEQYHGDSQAMEKRLLEPFEDITLCFLGNILMRATFLWIFSQNTILILAVYLTKSTLTWPLFDNNPVFMCHYVMSLCFAVTEIMFLERTLKSTLCN